MVTYDLISCPSLGPGQHVHVPQEKSILEQQRNEERIIQENEEKGIYMSCHVAYMSCDFAGSCEVAYTSCDLLIPCR